MVVELLLVANLLVALAEDVAPYVPECLLEYRSNAISTCCESVAEVDACMRAWSKSRLSDGKRAVASAVESSGK